MFTDELVRIPCQETKYVSFLPEEIDEIVNLDHVDNQLAIKHTADLLHVSKALAEQLVNNIVLMRITNGMRSIDPNTLSF